MGILINTTKSALVQILQCTMYCILYHLQNGCVDGACTSTDRSRASANTSQKSSVLSSQSSPVSVSIPRFLAALSPSPKPPPRSRVKSSRISCSSMSPCSIFLIAMAYAARMSGTRNVRFRDNETLRRKELGECKALSLSSATLGHGVQAGTGERYRGNKIRFTIFDLLERFVRHMLFICKTSDIRR